MARIALSNGLSLHCAVDDYLWPWQRPAPVVMLHGFARNATFWNRWVPRSPRRGASIGRT